MPWATGSVVEGLVIGLTQVPPKYFFRVCCKYLASFTSVPSTTQNLLHVLAVQSGEYHKKAVQRELRIETWKFVGT